MQPVEPSAIRYDRNTMLLHWLTALLVVAQWCVAQMIDWAPRGAPRVPMRSLHLSIGVILTVVIVVRLIWRATQGRRLPAASALPLHVLAKATHWAMYTLIVLLVLLGLSLWWVRGDTWFFVFTPAPASWSTPAVRQFIDYWHGTLANVLMILAGIHAAAAIFHRLVLRDGVLARMVVRNAR